MRTVLHIAITATALSFGAASAHAQGVGGGGVSGAYARPPGMGPNDTASEPSNRDKLINGIRADSVERSAKQAREGAAYAAPAGPKQIVAGSALNDRRGKPMGMVDAVEADGAIVGNGMGRIKVPLDAFGRNKKGLMLDVSKEEFDKMIADANAPAK